MKNEVRLNYVNGELVGPVTGVPSEIDVVTAVRAAQRASTEWAALTGDARAQLVRALVEGIVEDGSFALNEAYDEIERARTTSRRALGVIGIILPRGSVTRTLVPAMASLLTAGNTLIMKPSIRGGNEVANMVPLLAPLPAGVCNVVFGAGEPVGRFLVEHPGVPGIMFKGRSETGRTVVAQTSAALKRTSMWLGSKNAAIVLKDADLDRTVEIVARAAFQRSYLDAFTLSKVLVQKEVAEDFLTRLRAAAPTVVPSSAEFDHWVALARKENGRVTGGEHEGDFVRPAIVSELTNCSEIHQTELLSPLLTVNEIKYPPEGVKWANTSPFGRAAAIFTANRELARKLAGQLEVGTVWINGWRDEPGVKPGLGRAIKASAAGEADLLRFGTRDVRVIE